MGVVYLASDPMLNRQVAVKTVDLGLDDPDEREFLRNRLLRDARAAAVLKHPNIVSIHDVFEDGERAYVVMEYIEGDSLAARLKANPLPNAATILQVLGQMADALDYTHSRGVIHRDIKPANVMIDTAGTAKIMDFGIARIGDTRTMTPTGMVMGTVEFMAPEQIRGETVDGRADQFSLAVVAYQMMTGSTLFGPHTLATLTYKIVNETPPPPCTLNAALPQAVDAILAKALAKTPAERFTNCGEFVRALAQAFSDTPTTRVTAIPLPKPAGSARRSRLPVLTVVVAVVVAVVAVGGALAVWKPWERTPQPPEQVAAARPAAVTPSDVTPTDVTPAPVPTPETVAPAPSPVAEPKPEPQEAKPNRAVSTPQAVTPSPAALPPIAPPERPAEAEPLPPPAVPKTGTIPAPFDMAIQRGQEQFKTKDYAGAIQSYKKAIELRPKYAPAYYSLGVAQYILERDELALQNYSEAIRLAPDMPLAYAARGVCLVRLHRDPDALIDFERALQLKPDLGIALNGRGGVYFRLGQYGRALRDYDEAIRSNPGFAPAYLNRARAREALGDFSGAAADRQREAELRKK